MNCTVTIVKYLTIVINCRFNTDIIEERRGSISIFLNFVAEQPQLFTCHEFVKFFEASTAAFVSSIR